MITYEDLKDALKHNRSVRRFQEDKRIDIDTLEKLVDLRDYVLRPPIGNR